MYLDNRAKSILEAIVNTPQITGKELQEQMDLSRKQLSYSFNKINEYLSEKKYPKIQRLKTGKFIVSQEVVTHFQTNNHQEIITDFVYNEEERQCLIKLVLLTTTTVLSTYDFVLTLQISKNTLLNDFRKIKQELSSKYNLTINYSRQDGYSIIGEEYAKRLLLIEELRKILAFINGEKKLKKVIKIREDDIAKIKFEISKLEQELAVRYPSSFIAELPYIIYFILEISKIYELTTLPLRFQYMLGTKEYAVVKEQLGKYFLLDENELMILIAIMQAQNVESSTIVEDNELNSKLAQAIEEIINLFEKNSMIEIKHKVELKEMLFQHCRPAFFRIKYNYHINENIIDLVLPTYQNLFNLVKKSVKPFSDLLNVEINDNELAYLTILFGGMLKREGTACKVEVKKKAIVVCTNGTSISNYMYLTFQELFPEFEFLGWYSLRSFNELTTEFDIVFSTVKLKTKKALFIYKPFSNQRAQIKFREQVLQTLEGVSINNVYTFEIMNIIKKYANVCNTAKLEKELDKYLHPTVTDKENTSLIKQAKLRLTDLINKNTVMVQNSIIPWDKAILRCGQPLVENQTIQKSYLTKIIHEIKQDHPFIMIALNVVIAHSSIDSGVNKVGISIMKFQHPLDIDGYMQADILIVLATPNFTDHLGVLNDLINITENKETLTKIKEATKALEIIKIINDFKEENKC